MVTAKERIKDYLKNCNENEIKIDEFYNVDFANRGKAYAKSTVESALEDLGIDYSSQTFNNPYFSAPDPFSEAVNLTNDFIKMIKNASLSKKPYQINLDGVINYQSINLDAGQKEQLREKIANELTVFYNRDNSGLNLKLWVEEADFNTLSAGEKDLVSRIEWTGGDAYYINKKVLEAKAKESSRKEIMDWFEKEYSINTIPSAKKTITGLINDIFGIDPFTERLEVIERQSKSVNSLPNNKKPYEISVDDIINQTGFTDPDQKDRIRGVLINSLNPFYDYDDGSDNLYLKLFVHETHYNNFVVDEEKNLFKGINWAGEENAFYINKRALYKKAELTPEKELREDLAKRFKGTKEWATANTLINLINESYTKVFVESGSETLFEQDLETGIAYFFAHVTGALDAGKRVGSAYLFKNIAMSFLTSKNINAFLNRNVDIKAFCDYNPEDGEFYVNLSEDEPEKSVKKNGEDYDLILDSFVKVFEKNQKSIEKEFKEYFDKFITENESFFEVDLKKFPKYLFESYGKEKLKAAGFKEVWIDDSTKQYSKTSGEEIEIKEDYSIIESIWDEIKRHTNSTNLYSVASSYASFKDKLENPKLFHDLSCATLMQGFNYDTVYRKLNTALKISIDYIENFNKEKIKELDGINNLNHDEQEFIIDNLEEKMKTISRADKAKLKGMIKMITKSKESADKQEEAFLESMKETYEEITEESIIEGMNNALESFNKMVAESTEQIEDKTKEFKNTLRMLAKKL